jgi:riboflavin synthase
MGRRGGLNLPYGSCVKNMFSGIIEELGRVKRVFKKGNLATLEISADKVLADTRVGDSVAVCGVCLTVVKVDRTSLSFEVMPETLKTTNLGALCISEKVNLERSLKLGDRLSGHFVTGHVDCMGAIRRKTHSGGNLVFEIAAPVKLLTYCLPKGSVCVDGISLTVMQKRADTFSVYLIPHTLKNTTLGFKGPSDKVNIEFDILAKKSS